MKKIFNLIIRKSLFIIHKFPKLIFWRGYSRRNKSATFVGLIILGLVSFFYIRVAINPGKSEAAWFNTDWPFRKAINISAHTSAEANVYLNLSSGNALDTSDATKFQGDCGDLRFTDASGNLLPYYIASGCGTSSTVIHVFMKNFPAGAQTIYYYYGNFNAVNGFSTSDFSTAASGVTISGLGLEENGPQPIAYWAFDDGTGTVAKDSTTTGADATLANLDSQPSTRSGWMREDQCIVGKCVKFAGGATGSVTVAKSVSNIETVSFWVNPASTSAALVDLNASDASIIATAGTITAPNFTSPTIYVNGALGSTLVANQWNFITVVTGSGLTGSTIKIGNVKGNYLNGFIDEVKFYDYQRSSAQVQSEYITRGSRSASGNVLGASTNSTLSNGLVGYWKMDEDHWAGTTGEVGDSSGNGNNGTASGNATTAVGEFGNGGIFDGTNDHVSMGTPASLQITGSVTMSAWVKFNSLSADNFVAGRLDSGAGGAYWMGYSNSINSVGMTVLVGVTQYTVGGAGIVSTGNWYHLVGVYDSNARILRFYVNGALVGETTGVPASINAAGTIGFTVGETTNGISDLNGRVDELRVYNRAFSQYEVSQLYNFAPGPVGYWNFEEGRGSTANDTSGNGFNGTWAGTLGSQWTQGKYGKGGKFNGTDNYVTVGASHYNFLKTTAFSGGAWIKTTGSGSVIADWNLTATPGWQSGVGDFAAGKFFLILSDTSGNNYFARSGSTDLRDNQWHYVAFTYDGSAAASGINLYVDGKLETMTNFTLGTTNPGTLVDNGLQIGARQTFGLPSDLFTGSIDDAKVFNYVRSSKQIVSDMNGGHPNVGSPVGSAVGQWDFDEQYGATANNSGNGGSILAGTLTNMASPATAVSGWNLAGKFGGALAFDGSNDFVSIASNPLGLQITNDIAISAWINLSNTSSVHDIISKKGASGQFGYRLSTDASGKLNFELSSSGSNTRAATGSSTLVPNKWYHVAGTYSANNAITVYVNGQQDGQVTTSLPASIFNSSANVNIGAENNGGSNFMAGIIDQPRIYNYSLTSLEIGLDMNQGKSLVLGALSDTSGLTGGSVASNSASAEYCIPGDTTSCAPPIARWDFEEGQGSTVNDTSGTSTSGTWNGTAQWAQGKIGNAAKFNGTNSFVDSVALSTYTPPWTVAMWIKAGVTGQPANIGIFSTKSQTGSGCAGNSVYIKGSSGSPGNYTFGNSLNNPACQITIGPQSTSWHHIVVTVAAGGATTAYYDGVQTNTGSFNLGGNLLRLGVSSQGTDFFNGSIDKFEFFNRVLTPAQVAWDYNRGAPVAYYDLDECQGTTIHDYSGNNNLTLTVAGEAAGTCQTSSTAWGSGAIGKFNASLHFDGSNYVSGSDANMPSGASPRTMSIWINPTSLPTSGNYITMMGYGDGTTQSELYLHNNSGSQEVTLSFAPFNITATYTLPTGTWSHIVGTFDGTTGKVYVNGKLVASSGATVNTVLGSLSIGRDIDTSSPVVGQLDDARIYNYALTASQVRNVYNQNSAVRFGPVTGAP